jgi:hypothetical protein
VNTLVRHRYSSFVELKQALKIDVPLPPSKGYIFGLTNKELRTRALVRPKRYRGRLCVRE